MSVGSTFNWKNYFGLRDRLRLGVGGQLKPEAIEHFKRYFLGSPYSDPLLASEILASYNAVDFEWLTKGLASYDEIYSVSLPIPEWGRYVDELYAGEQTIDINQVSPSAPGHIFHPIYLAFSGRLDEEAAIQSGGTIHFGARASFPAVVKGLKVSLAGVLKAYSSLVLVQEQRIREMHHSHQEPTSALELLRHYPVIVERTLSVAGHWLESSIQFLERFCADWSRLMSTLLAGNEDVVTKLDTGLGDTHGQGGSVICLTFDSGQKVIYKPTDQSMFSEFQGIVQDVVLTLGQLTFRPLTVVSGNGYGWIESIDHEVAQNPAEIEHYYRAMGVQLAIAFVLGITDLHSENLIAHRDWPYLIDLETAFAPAMASSPASPQEDEVERLLASSTVLATGLLPVARFQRSISAFKDIDTSGITGVVPGTTQGDYSPNLPHALGAFHPAVFSDAVCDGFERSYECLRLNWTSIVEEPKRITRLKESRVRVVLRATQVYETLRLASTHPDCCASGLELDLLLDKLWLGCGATPTLAKAVPREQQALRNGDIPYFWTTADSTYLFDSASSVPVEGMIVTSGWDLCIERQQAMSKTDLMLQLELIRAAMWFESLGAPVPLLADLNGVSGSRTQQATDFYNRSLALSQSGEYLSQVELAEALARIVQARRRVTRGNCVVWLDAVSTPDGRAIGKLEDRFWDGRPGIGLLFAALYQHTKDSHYRELALDIFEHSAHGFATSNEALVGGAFEGSASVLFATSLARSFLPELKDIAEEILSVVTQAIGMQPVSKGDYPGVVNGVAGRLLVLASFAGPNEKALVRRLADCLLDSMIESDGLVGWTAGQFGVLAGMAHGTSGVALALSAAAKLLGEPKYMAAAQRASQFEDDTNSSGAIHWSQNVNNDAIQNGESWPSWSYGAPGIGIARLAAYQNTGDVSLLRNMPYALSKTAESRGRSLHSVATGTIASATFLVSAGSILGKAEVQLQGERLFAQVVDELKSGRFTSVLRGEVQSCGFMTGLAGVAYSLLVPLYSPSSKSMFSLLALQGGGSQD